MKFRDNGAIGAILDEYEKTINELKSVICDITQDDLVLIVDHETTDEDCKSIQSILSHTVTAGYTYAIETRKWLGEDIEYKKIGLLDTADEYIKALSTMFVYNEQLFAEFPNLEFENHDPEKKMKVRWGQRYDIEQLFEHAIVHILRHRRQIERFIVLINTKN